MTFDDSRLIFIVSQPRAGSTLLQFILAGAPGVHSTAEPWLMLHPLYALRETGHTADYDAKVAQRALSDFLAAFPEGQDAYEKAVRGMALALYGRACEIHEKTWFVDKTPRYYKILPDLGRVFPSARFILLFRNPAAVLASILRTWVAGNWTQFDYFHDDLMEAPYRLIEGSSHLGDRAINVNYERLIANPESTIASTCAWLGLAFEPASLEYGNRPKLSGRYGDPTSIGQYRKPFNGKLFNWLEDARDPQIRHLQLAYLDALGPDTLNRMGYSFAEIHSAINAVKSYPGRPLITWEQLMKRRKNKIGKFSLILSEARRHREVRQLIIQTGRLLAGRL